MQGGPPQRVILDGTVVLGELRIGGEVHRVVGRPELLEREREVVLHSLFSAAREGVPPRVVSPPTCASAPAGYSFKVQSNAAPAA